MTATTERPTLPAGDIEAVHWNAHVGDAQHRAGPHVRLSLEYTPGDEVCALDLELDDRKRWAADGRRPYFLVGVTEDEACSDLRLRLDGITPAALETLEAAVAALMVRLRAAGIVPPVGDR